ncbi:MAG: four helix bundle protein [Ignavibacteriales bacterium]|jgi:four helix bundle protein|nr:four helix bundle protein [Ignavibacteriales bacterium]MBK8663088.1 four helix bundle protein [Ignavibacteriales bacterium]
MINHFTDMIVWQKARLLFKELYELMRNSKDYFLRDQILRATLSISNNIAEGFGRYSKKEYIQFLNIARGSANEVESMLFILQDVSSIEKTKLIELQGILSDIRNLLNALIQTLLRRISEEETSRKNH